MNQFGFFSSLLKTEPSFWNLIGDYLPDKWRYRFGPVRTGAISGCLSGEQINGFGWNLPVVVASLWDDSKLLKFWQRLAFEFKQRQINFIGVDPSSSFEPPPQLFHLENNLDLSVSDGKALELLIFLNYFQRLLRNYEIASQKTSVMLIWEEGNLGLIGARLLAREVRFLTFVHPNLTFLDRAMQLIMSETGVSPQIYTSIPDLSRIKILIKCGELVNYNISKVPHVIYCELFQKNALLHTADIDLLITTVREHRKVLLYPALGETILRSLLNLRGCWYGSELQFERVIKLATGLKELGQYTTI